MKGHPPAHTPARSLAVKVLVLVNVVALVVFLAATRSMQREVRDEMKFESEKRMGMERASPPRVRARPATPAPPSWYRARRWRHHLLERGREEVRARYAIPALSRLSTAPSFLAVPPPPPPTSISNLPPLSLSIQPTDASRPATAARAARRLGAGARRAASSALPSCPPCEAAAAAGAGALLEPGPGGEHPKVAFLNGKYSPYRDPTLHPLDWWATHAGLAAEAAAAAAAAATAGGGGGGVASSGLTLPPLPPRSYAGPLDVDALAAARKTALDAGGLAGAQGAARGRRGYFLSYVETDPMYPFQRVRFADGTDSGVVALIAPFYDTNYFRAETQRALFWRLKARGHIMVGVSSYQVSRNGERREEG